MKLKTTYYINLLNQFDTHIRSTKSIDSGNHYTGQINDFLIFLENNEILNLKKVDTPIMKDYFNHLVTRPKKRGEGTLSLATINDNLSTLNLFSLRMQKGDVINRGLPIPNRIKIEQYNNNGFALVREILTVEEIKEVFQSCISDTEKALIALAYGCGLRRSTLANLSEFQINFQSGLVTALKAKNNKTRQVPISDFFLKELRNYSLFRLKLLSNLNKREQTFFVDERGLPISGDRLNRKLKNIIKRTQNQTIIDKNITLHCLRHSISVHLMDAGESFEYVKNFLGHSIADTTLIYARRRKIKNYYAI